MNATSSSVTSAAGVCQHIVSQLALTRRSDRGLPGSRILSLLLLLVFSFMTQVLSAAEVTTDKSDYPPGSTVQIAGSGFLANEIVHCEVDHVDGLDTGAGHEHWEVTADGSGNFTTTWYVNPDDSIGASLLLTAEGQTSGLIATAAFTDAFGPGTAPVSPPTGGFAIDGNLEANIPTPTGIGDWVPHTPGTGGSVLTSAGVPIDPANTFHLTDLYDTDEDNFAGGLKYFDNPTTWTWVNTNKAPAKNDINHGLLHFTTDASGNTWLAVASDRFSSNGAAYIDFEFLQKTLSMTGTGGGTKGFASAGPDGGRTVGDFLLTLSLTNGGSVAGFKVERWEADASVPLGFTYHDRTTSVPVGSVFAAVNTTTVPVSFGAFGGTTYDVNTFVEGAVNLTALLGAIDPCASLGIKTLLVKCKTSAADTATITDFIAPLHIDKRIGIADAGTDQAKCSEGASTSFTLAGVATVPSPDVVGSTTWSVVSGTANITTPGSLNSPVSVSGASATLRLTVVTSPHNCTTTDDVVLTVTPVPDCTITGPDGPLCPNLIGNQYSGVAGMSSYAWSISGNGSIVGAANTQTVSVTAGAGCASAFTLTLTVTNASANGCSNTCTRTIEVGDTTPPTASNPAPVTVLCLAAVPASNTEVVTTEADNCGTPSVAFVSDATDGKKCPETITRTYRVSDACANSILVTQTITVADTTPPTASNPAPVTVLCLAAVPASNTDVVTTEADNCGTPSVAFVSDATDGKKCPETITRSYRVSDACANSILVTQTITVADTTSPTASNPAPVTVQCLAAVPASNTDVVTTEADNCGTPSVAFVSEANEGNSCPETITRSYRVTDACANSILVTQTITVADTTPPTASNLAPVTVQCLAAVPASNIDAVTTEADNCGTPSVAFVSDVNDGKTCPATITRSYRVSDACANSILVTQTITVADTTLPTASNLAPVTVEFVSSMPAARFAAVTTAADNCSVPVVTFVGDVSDRKSCPETITRSYRVADACDNSILITQTITVVDTTKTVITSPPAASVPYPSVPVPATTVEELVGLGGSANDTSGAVTISSSDSEPTGSCPAIIVRTYTATDECGKASTCEQTISQFCPSLVTSSSLCTFDMDADCKDAFRLNFHQRTDAPSLWRIVSTNPGQFYYNFFVSGTPGADVNATATIPYPFVTHGAQPIHVYSDFIITGSKEAGYCLVPGTGLDGFTITTAGGHTSTNGAAIIALGDYTSTTPQTTVTVSGGKIPPSGTLAVTIHLDYALKKTNEWSLVSNAAVGSGSLLGITLNPCQEYEFSFTDGVIHDQQVVHSVNAFKKNPGFGASVVLSADLGSTPVQGVKFEAWNSTGTIKIGQAFTGEDGSGLIPYKQKAKPEEYWIKVPAYQKAFKVTLKANGFGFGEFEVP